MSLHKKLKAHFSAALGGETKAASEPAPDERPHFVRDYTRMVAELKKTFPLEEAMSLAVGGSYDIIGKIERRILEHYGLRTGMAVLDMGCGSGRLSTVLSDMDIDYLGTDIVPDLLEYARTKSRKSFRFVLHTELNVPVPSNTIDIACAFSLFTHLHHHETYIYLEDVFRALKPGGKVIFSFLEFAEKNHWSVFIATVRNKQAGVPQHLNQFIERSAISLWATQIGFEIIEFVDGMALPWGERAIGQAVVVLQKPA